MVAVLQPFSLLVVIVLHLCAADFIKIKISAS